jgi:hypothetical protein
MKKLFSALIVLAFATQLFSAQDLTSRFNADKMRERVKRLSADDFEGRGPGTAGGRRAAQYIADQMKQAGIAQYTTRYNRERWKRILQIWRRFCCVYRLAGGKRFAENRSRFCWLWRRCPVLQMERL